MWRAGRHSRPKGFDVNSFSLFILFLPFVYGAREGTRVCGRVVLGDVQLVHGAREDTQVGGREAFGSVRRGGGRGGE